MKANLFIPGMPKCGSFFLYDLLRQHPNICMSNRKEPAFFTTIYDIEEYDSYFESNESIFYGEATVEYLIEKESLYRIKNEVESPKFIILLRHPVKRAISHYFHRYNSCVDETNLSDLLENSDCYPIKYSNYKKYLKIIFEIFEQNQILIIISEDLYNDTISTYNKILEFLELPNIVIKPNKANQNKAKVPKYKSISNHLKKLYRNDKLKNKLMFFLPLLKVIYKKIENFNMVEVQNKNSIDSTHISKIEKLLKSDAQFVREFLNRSDIWQELK